MVFPSDLNLLVLSNKKESSSDDFVPINFNSWNTVKVLEVVKYTDDCIVKNNKHFMTMKKIPDYYSKNLPHV